LLAADFRRNRQYRVTYISNCARWRCNELFYFLRELVTTFHDDSNIGGKDIVQWCYDIINSANDKKVMLLLIEALLIYTQEQKLQWLFIFDQLNALYSDRNVAKDFPFNLITELSERQDKHVRVIVSGFENNEGYPTEMQGWYIHHLPNCYDDDEFAIWCEKCPLDDHCKIDPKSAAASNALYWSGTFFIHTFNFYPNHFIQQGGIPLEINFIWKQPAPTLDKKVTLYCKERVKEMSQSHKKFYYSLFEEDRKNLEEFVSLMALELSPPKFDLGMDRDLLEIVTNEEGKQIVSALNPIARKALLIYHGQSLIAPLGLVADKTFDHMESTNNVKERVAELYIITRMDVEVKNSTNPYTITKNSFPE
jgi:hypothetical protein